MPIPTGTSPFNLYLQQQQKLQRKLMGQATNVDAFGKPLVTPTVGGGGTNGANIPHIGGETWAGSSNQNGEQFTAMPFNYGGPRHGGSGGLTQSPTIKGYVGSGIPTNEFSDAVGRAPTAADYEALNGGSLSPAYPAMGFLPPPVPVAGASVVAPPQVPQTDLNPLADKSAENAIKAAQAASNAFNPLGTGFSAGAANVAGNAVNEATKGLYGTGEQSRIRRSALKSGKYLGSLTS